MLRSIQSSVAIWRGEKTNLDGKDLGRLPEIDRTEAGCILDTEKRERKSAGWNRTGDEGAKPANRACVKARKQSMREEEKGW